MADSTQDVVSPEEQRALDVARNMIQAGIPIFAAPPCPAAHGGQCSRPGHTGQEEYDLPPKWQLTVPSDVWLERWKPGWGLAAVGGHLADFLDTDPRNGGEASEAELVASGQWPRTYGVAETPSGGRHAVIRALGERKGEALPGLDYQGGAPSGEGRGFVWIAPTVKRSKIDGERRAYRWLQEPDVEWLADSPNDESGQLLASRIRAARERKPPAGQPDERGLKEFTEQDARAFCDITLDRLRAAQIGQIEECANAAAVQLSHFVPDFWSEEFAYAVLHAALGETAYDPDHPASRWTAEKFHAVLAGERNRAPRDWKAVRKPAGVEEAAEAVTGDEVDALIAEMLRAGQLAELPPPSPLIRGLLTLDSESWIIGEPGSKKSFVALDMAGHVARGMPWQGMPVTKGRVVFIVAEGASGSGIRVRAWEKTYGAMDDGPERMTWVLPRPVQARDLKKWAVLVEACRRIQPALVVVDTQARVTVGLKENDATDMGYYVAAVSAIRQATGACVLTIHHTGRQGGDARGSSAIDGAQSTELKVESQGLRGRLLVEKQKDLPELPAIPLRFRVVDLGVDSEGEQITSLVLREEESFAEGEVRPEEVPEPGQEAVVPEPESWTWKVVDHSRSVNQRRILQVLASVAGQVGITENAAQRVVRDRWYEGRPIKAKRSGHLDSKTWQDSWTAVIAPLTTPSGEPVVINPREKRYAINPSAVSELGG